MSSPVVNGVAKAVPDVVRGWGIYSLIALFMVGAGWVATGALGRQQDLIEKVCNAQLDVISAKISQAQVDTKAVLNNQTNLVPMVVQQQEQIGRLIEAVGKVSRQQETGYGP